MSYGFGLAGEGVGQFTEGARQQQEHEARKEERRINQLYTRYQLSAERRKDAEQQYQEHAAAVGEAASGSPQEAEAYNARDEERKLRASLYDSLSGKGPKAKGLPKGPKGWLYRAIGMDETKKPPEEGYDKPPTAQPSAPRRPMDERLPDGRTVIESIGGKRYSLASPVPTMGAAGSSEPAVASGPTTPAETAPGMAPRAKALTLQAMTENPPITGAEQIPQDVEEPNRGQFAPEGRVQAGLNYEWAKGAPPRSGSEIRGGMAQKIPMATPKTLDSATALAVQKEADNIMTNLEGYIDHVKRTAQTDDDSFEHAQKDPGFNKYLGGLKKLEAGGYLKANTVDEFLDKSFADSPARMRGRPTPTAAQAAENELFASIGKPGGPKTYEEALQRVAVAKASPRSSSERAKLESLAIQQRLGEKNPKTGKPYTAWEVLQGLPRSAAPGEDVGPTGSIITAASEDTDEPGFFRGPKTGQPGTTLSPMGGAKPKTDKIPIESLQVPAPKFKTDAKGNVTGLHPLAGQKILSAARIIQLSKSQPYAMTWQDVKDYVDTPELFEDPAEHAKLKKMFESMESEDPMKDFLSKPKK